MSQRILHIIDSLGHTGTAHQLLLLATGLIEQGYDIQVAALDRGGALAPQLAASGIPVFVSDRRTAIDPVAFLRLRRHIARLRPSVIHTWTADAAFYTHAATRWGGWGRASGEPPVKPQLIMGIYRIDRGRPGWRQFLHRRLAQHADRIVTNSETVRDWSTANGLPAGKFAIIPSGIRCATGSTRLSSPKSASVGAADSTGKASGTRPAPSDVSREDLLRELKLPLNAKLIGIIGRLVPEKRVRDLIWAADLLRVLHDNLRVLIIGDGPLRAQLERYARLASDLDHIQFLGERDDVWRIMPHLDALWNGSDNVSQSVVILEAMAAGVPVVASDVPVNRELIVEGETGYLIPIGSRAGRAARARHTDRIFTDKEHASRLGAASQSRATAYFNSDRLVSDHTKLYPPLS